MQNGNCFKICLTVLWDALHEQELRPRHVWSGFGRAHYSHLNSATASHPRLEGHVPDHRRFVHPHLLQWSAVTVTPPGIGKSVTITDCHSNSVTLVQCTVIGHFQVFLAVQQAGGQYYRS